MKCKLCWRAVTSELGFCRYHQMAYENLKTAFEKWRLAYGDLTWGSYLKRVVSLKETGVWVKEVAELELKCNSEEAPE